MKYSLLIATVAAAENKQCVAPEGSPVELVANEAIYYSPEECGMFCMDSVDTNSDKENYDWCCNYSVPEEGDPSCFLAYIPAQDPWTTVLFTATDSADDMYRYHAWEWQRGAYIEDAIDEYAEDQDDYSDSDSARALRATLFATAAIAMAY